MLVAASSATTPFLRCRVFWCLKGLSAVIAVGVVSYYCSLSSPSLPASLRRKVNASDQLDEDARLVALKDFLLKFPEMVNFQVPLFSVATFIS